MSESNVIELRDTKDKAQTLADGLEMVQRWRRILAIRWLCFIAVFVGCVIWVGAMIAGTMWASVAAAGYSIGVLAPVLVLYFLTHKAE